MHACFVSMAHKVLKQYPRYDQKIFMNVVTDDESLIHYFKPHRKIRNKNHQNCKKVLYFQKDYQFEKGYACHIFH